MPSYIKFLRFNKLTSEIDKNQRRYFNAIKSQAEYYLDKKEGAIAIHHLQHAIKLANDFGFKSEIKPLKEMLQPASDMIEWAEIKVTEKIDSESLINEFEADVAERCRDSKEPYLDYLVNLHRGIPSLADMSKTINERLEQGVGVYQSVFPTVHYSNGLPRSRDTSGEMMKEKKELVLWTTLTEYYYTIIFEYLIKEGLSYEKVYDYLLTGLQLDPPDNPFLLQGIKAYFEKDYIASLHILFPQVERIVREILVKKYPYLLTHRTRENGVEFYKKKYDIIATSEAYDLLGERFCVFVIINLFDPKHRNLRNRFLHGLAEYKEAKTQIAFLLIWILLMVTGLVKNTE